MRINVKLHYESTVAELLRMINGFEQGRIFAFTIGNHVFFNCSKGMLKVSDRKLLRHELIHVCQYTDFGKMKDKKITLSAIIKFLYDYLWTQRKVKYMNKNQEIEAYYHQFDTGYIKHKWPHIDILLSDNFTF